MLIDTFVNAIFLYDDKMVITFNYKDGENIEVPHDMSYEEWKKNILPTGSNFVVAGARGYDFGMVATHDGKVYLYKAGEKVFRSEYFNSMVDKYVSEPYIYDIKSAQIKTLSYFEELYGIGRKEIK